MLNDNEDLNTGWCNCDLTMEAKYFDVDFQVTLQHPV